MSDVSDLFIHGDKLFGEWLYRVMLHDKVYDHFITKESLTQSQMIDVANGYKEALDGYRSAMVP